MSGSGSAGMKTVVAIGVGVGVIGDGERPASPPGPTLGGVGVGVECGIAVLVGESVEAGSEVAVEVGESAEFEVGVGVRASSVTEVGGIWVGDSAAGGACSGAVVGVASCGLTVVVSPWQPATKIARLLTLTTSNPVVAKRLITLDKFQKSIKLVFGIPALRRCR